MSRFTRRSRTLATLALTAAATSSLLVTSHDAQAADLLGCDVPEVVLLEDDDGNDGVVTGLLPFAVFGGNAVTVSANGLLTLGDPPPAFSAENLPGTNSGLTLLPFYAEADLAVRASEAGVTRNVTLCTAVAGQPGTASVTWNNLAPTNTTDLVVERPTASFQVLLTAGPTCGAELGLTVEYRYGALGWVAAESMGGLNGECQFGTGLPTCLPARAAFQVDGTAGGAFFLPGSSVPTVASELLNANNTGIDGVWRFVLSPPDARFECGLAGDSCLIEECDPGSPFLNSQTCDLDCTFPVCSDGILNDLAGEECDDGNTAPYDGCRGDCTLETCAEDDFFIEINEGGFFGFADAEMCSALENDPTPCGPVADGDLSFSFSPPGRGIFDFSTGSKGGGQGEDIPSTTLYIRDACGSDTVLGCAEAEPGEFLELSAELNGIVVGRDQSIVVYTANTNDECEFLFLDVTGVMCGDGIVQALNSEDCDDGNNENGDGCDADCFVEECGNGVLQIGEVCDDGNLVEGDGCNDVCQIEECGNAVIDFGEDCDPEGPSPDCNPDCTFSVCGDGVLNTLSGEACDDGNVNNNDGCSSSCALEVCGDGIEQADEDCDDGNTTGGDGCAADCTDEFCGNGRVEGAEECDEEGDAPTCDADCTLAECGDGSLNTTAGELCDDGNLTPDDGCSATCTIEECGNGIVEGPEQCDDGNIGDGDGCNDVCQIEECGNGIVDAGEECDGEGETPDCDTDCSLPLCGDGVLNGLAGEFCDDGNTVDGDGCNDVCQIEECGNGVVDAGEECDDGNPSETCTGECLLSFCGDGLINDLAGEECDDAGESAGCNIDCTPTLCGDGVTNGTAGETCDDGNTDDDDGCSATCTLEGCGNGIVEGTEACDDGNTENGDGCSAACTEEVCGNGVVDAGEDCDSEGLQTADCEADCTTPLCGDAVLNAAAGEFCDDGNLVDGDGCNDVCAIEECGNGVVDAGEDCDSEGLQTADCEADCTTPLCGDAVLNAAAGEFCDDGNLVDGDGCNDVCAVEECGNGVVDAGEDCDDGNTTDGDGCAADCTIEEAPAECGDGNLDDGEECDDGNTTDGDGCAADCTIEEAPAECGDGNLDDGEECDDGNTTDGDGCAADCTIEEAPAECGDGNLDDGEECDDGNTTDGDGCDASCNIEESPAECGDGNVDDGETCDDGNTTSGDGCDASCTIEPEPEPEPEFELSGGACNNSIAGAPLAGAWWLCASFLGLLGFRRRR